MLKREQFDTIYDSIVNGQLEQAVNQMVDNDVSNMPDMLDYFAIELNQPEMAIKAAKLYFRFQPIDLSL